MPLAIRPVRPDEGADLRALRLRALADQPDAFGSTHAAEVALVDDVWRRRASEGGGADDRVTLIAADDEGWHAMFGAWVTQDAVAHAWGMWVAPPRRGSGVARALFEAVVAWARDRGATRLELCVSDAAPAAQALYASLGCRTTGAPIALREGSAIEARTLVLELVY